MINVIERISELMELKGWTPYELSNQTGITTNAIYDWFKGATPSIQNIIKVCDAFEITLEQFFCNGKYQYTDEDNKIFLEWLAMSDLERQTILDLINTFKILKKN